MRERHDGVENPAGPKNAIVLRHQPCDFVFDVLGHRVLGHRVLGHRPRYASRARLSRATHHVMRERIYPSALDVWIVRQIVPRVERRTGIATFSPTSTGVMQSWVDSRLGNVRIVRDTIEHRNGRSGPRFE